MATESRPIAERLSWIAGIAGTCLAFYVWLSPEKAPTSSASLPRAEPQHSSPSQTRSDDRSSERVYHLQHIADEGGFFASDERTRLDLALAQFRLTTHCPIAVVTVQSLGNESIEKFADRVHERWQWGEPGRAKSILLVLSRTERQARIEIGAGLDRAFPDQYVQQLMDRTIIPSFKRGHFAVGVIAALQELTDALNQVKLQGAS